MYACVRTLFFANALSCCLVEGLSCMTEIWGHLKHPAEAFVEEVHGKVTAVLSALVRTKFADHPKLASFFQEKVRSLPDICMQPSCVS